MVDAQALGAVVGQIWRRSIHSAIWDSLPTGMLSYKKASPDTIWVDQVRQSPCVYLDHWAIREFSTNPAIASRLQAAIELFHGTLALSLMTMTEFSGITDSSQADEAEQFVSRFLPRLFFLEHEPFTVIAREDELAAGTSRRAPEGDEALLATFAQLNDIERHGWSTRGMFRQIVEDRDMLRINLQSLTDAGIDGVRGLQLRLDNESELRHQMRMRLKGLLRPRSTMALLRELITQLQANRAHNPKRSDIIDLMHTVVPCSYCDFVLVDGRWSAEVQKAHSRMKAAGIETHVARVYSKGKNGIGRFLEALESSSS